MLGNWHPRSKGVQETQPKNYVSCYRNSQKYSDKQDTVESLQSEKHSAPLLYIGSFRYGSREVMVEIR